MGEGTNAPALMKALPIAVVLTLLSLGIVAGTVFGLGDEEILVSPPEIVAEEFVRALAHGRIGPARGMLDRDAERTTSGDDVRGMSAILRSRIGRLDKVHGTVAERRRDTATVRAQVEGERGNAELVLPMVREYGAWSVARPSDALGGATRPSIDPATHR
jgi:hypothetical protein